MTELVRKCEKCGIAYSLSSIYKRTDSGIIGHVLCSNCLWLDAVNDFTFLDDVMAYENDDKFSEISGYNASEPVAVMENAKGTYQLTASELKRFITNSLLPNEYFALVKKAEKGYDSNLSDEFYDEDGVALQPGGMSEEGYDIACRYYDELEEYLDKQEETINRIRQKVENQDDDI